MLRVLIENRGTTQARLAADTGIAESTVSEVLSGKRKLNRTQIGKLARYFRVEPSASSRSAGDGGHDRRKFSLASPGRGVVNRNRLFARTHSLIRRPPIRAWPPHFLPREALHVRTPSPPRVHADRAAGGHRHHRHPDRPAAARRAEGPRGRRPHAVHQQPQADRPGHATTTTTPTARFPRGGHYNPVDALTEPAVLSPGWGTPHYRASRGSWLYHILPYIEQDNLYKYSNGGSSPLSALVGVPLEPNFGGGWFSQPEPLRWARRSGASMHDIASGMAALNGQPNPFRVNPIRTFRCPTDPFTPPARPGGAALQLRRRVRPELPVRELRDRVHLPGQLHQRRLGAERRRQRADARTASWSWACSTGAASSSGSPTSPTGRSNTLLVGEILMGENSRVNEMLTPAGVGGRQELGEPRLHQHPPQPLHAARTAGHDLVQPTSNRMRSSGNYAVSLGYKSRHTGGANFAFTDGSVRFVSQFINQETYTYLSRRADGRVIPNF